MMANFVVSFDGSFLKYSARSWLSPYSLGAGAGAMLKKTENRGAECWSAGAGSGHLSPLVGRKAAAWCSCCRLDTGLVTTLPLRTLTGGQVLHPGAGSRCWVQVRMYRVMVTFDPTHCVATPLDSESRQPRPSYERSFVPATTATAATDTGTRDSRGECRAVQCVYRMIIRAFIGDGEGI